MQHISQKPKLAISIEKVLSFEGTDVIDICDATESALAKGSSSFTVGLHRIETKIREQLEAYWKGVLLVPERNLIVGRVDGVIAASIQLVKPLHSDLSTSFAGMVDSHFVAQWAKGYKLEEELLKFAEQEAIAADLEILKLSVRENFHDAINLYESCGYKRWGTLDKYEKIQGRYVAGHFYYKNL